MRYSTDGVSDPRIVGAFMPVMPVTPKATTNTQVRIIGQPGTMGIRAPKPEALPETMAGSRANQPSYSSPDVIFPSLYWTPPDNMHVPVSLFRDNEMPVPAVDRYRLAQVAMQGRKKGGQNAQAWPPAVQRWSALSGAGGLA